MAEISNAGYQKIRDWAQSSWKYISLRDSSNIEIIRLMAGDSRVSWTHIPEAQTLELTAMIKGSDSDIGALPKTFNSAAIYDVATGGTAISVEAFTSAFTIASVDDQLTVKHRLQIPKVI